MGAFKFRGAFNALSRFDAEQRRAGRGRLLVGQPRAGDRAGGAHARHPGHDRDAARRAGRARWPRPAATAREVVAYDRYTRGPRGDRPRAGRRARPDADPALRPPGRDRRPGHRRQGAVRGGRRRSTRCSSAWAAAACSPARRWRRGRCRRRAGSTASSPRPATTASSRCAPARSCTSTRRRPSPTAPRPSTWASSPSRSSGATSTTSSPPPTPSWSRRCGSSPSA